MLRVLPFLLPALIPSWRFFQTVEPSPRVQWAIADGVWRAYRPRPDHVGLPAMLWRLFWNPHWTETLYMVSLAERLSLDPDDHVSLAEIWARVARDAGVGRDGMIRFRLVFVDRASEAVMYEAPARRLSEIPRDV